jgi:hypothetical protein
VIELGEQLPGGFGGKLLFTLEGCRVLGHGTPLYLSGKSAEF